MQVCEGSSTSKYFPVACCSFYVRSVLTCSPWSTKVSSVNSFHPASCKSARSGAKASAAATSWCCAHDFFVAKMELLLPTKNEASSRDVYSFRNHSFSCFSSMTAISGPQKQHRHPQSRINTMRASRVRRHDPWQLRGSGSPKIWQISIYQAENIEQLPPSFKIDKEGCKYPVESRSETLRHFRSRGGLWVPNSLPDVFKSSKQWQRRAN